MKKDLLQSTQPQWKTQTIPIKWEASHGATVNRHLALSAKINVTQRRTQVCP